MAQNPISRVYDPLVVTAEDASDGLNALQTTIGIEQNTEVKTRADLTGLTTAEVDYLARKSFKAGTTQSKTVADSNAKAYIGTAINVLKPKLGNQWTSMWEAAGFSGGSIMIPRTMAGRFALLPLLGAYFTANPTHENAPLGITAAACATQHTGLSNARDLSNQANADAGAAKALRDAKMVALQVRLRGLLGELGQLLADDDPRWYAFGFNRPADPETPGQAENIVTTPGGVGIVLVDWDLARRADRYRVRIESTNEPPTELAVKETEETETSFTGLPSGVNVRATVEGINEAGIGELAVGGGLDVP